MGKQGSAVVRALSLALVAAWAPADAASAFLRLGDWHSAFAGLSYEVIGPRGAPMSGTARQLAASEAG